MKIERSKKSTPDIKEIETRDIENSDEEGDVFEESELSFRRAEQLIALGQAYIEDRPDSVDFDSVTVKQRPDDKMIYYTTDPFEVKELKKVYEEANTPG